MKFKSFANTHPISSSLVFLFFLAGFSSLAVADDDGFNKLDVNKDGQISLKEAVRDRLLASQFDAIDTNHDGMLSKDEYAVYKVTSSIKSKNTEDTPEASNN